MMKKEIEIENSNNWSNNESIKFREFLKEKSLSDIGIYSNYISNYEEIMEDRNIRFTNDDKTFKELKYTYIERELKNGILTKTYDYIQSLIENDSTNDPKEYHKQYYDIYRNANPTILNFKRIPKQIILEFIQYYTSNEIYEAFGNLYCDYNIIMFCFHNSSKSKEEYIEFIESIKFNSTEAKTKTTKTTKTKTKTDLSVTTQIPSILQCYNPKIPSSAPPSVAIQFPSFPSNLRLIGQVCSRKSSGRKRNVLYKLI
ncbi:hypothetical protein ACTA71_009278 [Dictyostelium dimigraforme]